MLWPQDTASIPQRLRGWLSRAPAPVFAIYGGLMAFGAYFAMYAFRQPFTVASYADAAPVLVQYKIALVIAQVFGYALSKVAGIKLVSELPPPRRAAAILALIGARGSLPDPVRADPGALEYRLPVRQWPFPGHDLGPGVRLSGRPARVRGAGRHAVRQLHCLLGRGQIGGRRA